MQQDSRIATCAQASIWMAGRHFYSRHRGLWYSTVEVHEAATRVTDSMLSQALPAGSGGLAIDHIVRARPGYQATD
jgi:hypothetical protein